MLIDLQIEDLGVIKQTQLPFSPNFTVLTGETGAGKTMVLNALGLLMGAKTDPKLIRAGASQLAIEGSWDISDWPLPQELVRGVGGEIADDGTVISTRLVTAGRSKAYLGGRAVPQGTLSEFTASLVTVHGQSDQQRLRTPSRQRAALDAYGMGTNYQFSTIAQNYQNLWDRRAQLGNLLQQLTQAATERAREAELISLSLAEVDKVTPLPGEHDELTATANRLANSEELRAGVARAYDILAGERDETPSGLANVAVLIDGARRDLQGAAGVDAALVPLVERAAEAGYLISDLASELAAYLDAIDADPALLEQTQQRLGELNGLARRLRMSTDEIVAWAGTAALRLAELENDSETISEIQAELATNAIEIERAATELTAARTKAASSLATGVTKELTGLGMKEAKLQITLNGSELGPSGADQVEFWLVPHLNATPSPLAKGASGGELSRIMLALELSLAAASQHPAASQKHESNQPLYTFVFDEIDAGVGGKAALEVGTRLARLAQQTQVIVVTHLPQVAAFADQHLVVHKDGGETSVSVVVGEQRVAEIARMLAGTDTSETALRHARELLDSSKSAGSPHTN
ncbi:MAG: DNA repair protein RecN [Cellulomonadaceae bacterium]|jgi:DNA repair protein RecN (Recombination protein N)|nr:DNA repair protein RecN [Cellulomonadaceae bacterium]